MLRAIRDLPIKHKLLAILLLTSGTAILTSGITIILSDLFLYQRAIERDLGTLAAIIGNDVGTSMASNEPAAAAKTLKALQALPNMVSACVFTETGSPYAEYFRAGAPRTCPEPSTAGIQLTSAGFQASRPIMVGNRRAGTLVLLLDTGQLIERMLIYGGIVLAILIASSLLAFLLSSDLRNLITGPTSQLATVARAISQTGDYSVRVPRSSDDEFGTLVDAFNEMLGHIQSRDVDVQNARNFLQTTLTSIGDAVLSTDHEGRILFANPIAQALLRWPDPLILGRPIDEVFRIKEESTNQPLESPVHRALREGIIASASDHTILIARDGTQIPIDDSAAPIRQGGKTVGAVLVFRDSSERRRAQQDAAYLAAIVESSDDAIIGKTPAGVIQTWNEGAERLYGYPAAEVIGLPMLQLIPPERRFEEFNILERLRSGRRIVHFETIRTRKDGSQIDVSLTISPIRDRSGQIVGISHVARDITEQKRHAEQMRQTQKLESLGVLAGGIAHDFNNLLTGILGNASIALEDLPPNSPAREPILGTIAASERAAQLARQMLAYSGKGQFVVEHLNLSERVRDTIPLIKAAIPTKVELHLNLQERLPLIEADAAQIQQLVMNVIINAAEAIPEGQPGSLSITTRAQDVDEVYIRSLGKAPNGELTPGPHVLFEVRDTGIGMDESTLARIFDPFFTTKFTGRGLGLSAVLGIVRGHRGVVHVVSSLGQGTIFRFLFPAVAAAEPRELPAPNTQASSATLSGAGLILVVDDEDIVRDMARQVLERYGYSVLLASNGAVGADLYRDHIRRILCVILDLTMPVMNGEEALARMKAINPNVPIILSTGFNEAQAIQRFEGKGLAGFLQKPYRAAALLEKIKTVLGARKDIASSSA